MAGVGAYTSGRGPLRIHPKATAVFTPETVNAPEFSRVTANREDGLGPDGVFHFALRGNGEFGTTGVDTATYTFGPTADEGSPSHSCIISMTDLSGVPAQGTVNPLSVDLFAGIEVGGQTRIDYRLVESGIDTSKDYTFNMTAQAFAALPIAFSSEGDLSATADMKESTYTYRFFPEKYQPVRRLSAKVIGGGMFAESVVRAAAHVPECRYCNHKTIQLVSGRLFFVAGVGGEEDTTQGSCRAKLLYCSNCEAVSNLAGLARPVRIGAQKLAISLSDPDDPGAGRYANLLLAMVQKDIT